MQRPSRDVPGSRVVLVVALTTTIALLDCAKENNIQQAIVGQSPEQIPPASPALTGGSPPADYVKYGDQLIFDVGATTTLQRTVNGSQTETRIRSELRAPNTADSAYDSGRIIAKLETVKNESPHFKVPVGIAYVWVKKLTPSTYHGVLFRQNYLTGVIDSMPLDFQYHLQRANLAPQPQSFMFASGDTTTLGWCVFCGGFRLNCSGYGANSSYASIDALVQAAGH